MLQRQQLQEQVFDRVQWRWLWPLWVSFSLLLHFQAQLSVSLILTFAFFFFYLSVLVGKATPKNKATPHKPRSAAKKDRSVCEVNTYVSDDMASRVFVIFSCQFGPSCFPIQVLILIVKLVSVPLFLLWALTTTTILRRVSDLLSTWYLCFVSIYTNIKLKFDFMSFYLLSSFAASQNTCCQRQENVRKQQWGQVKLFRLLLEMHHRYLKLFILTRVFFLHLIISLKNFIVDDYSSDDDFIEQRPVFKGSSE